MATINMADLDWLTAYSELAQVASQQFQPGAGLGMMQAPLAISVTFDASETFSAFQIEVPFAVPGQDVVFGVPAAGFIGGFGEGTELSFTEYSLLSQPSQPGHGIEVSGTNTSDSPVTASFQLMYLWPTAPIPE